MIVLWCMGGFRGHSIRPPWCRKTPVSRTAISLSVTIFLSGSLSTLRKLYFHFLSHWMGYDRGDNFPFNFLNPIEFHLVQNRKENCHHDHIPFTVKGNGNTVFSVHVVRTHREIFLKSYQINPKSYCIYHFPIDLEPNGQCPFAILNQSENDKYNLISVWLKKIPKRILCI